MSGGRGASPVYVGLVTRSLAFVLDAVAVNVAALIATALVNLILSVVTVGQTTRTVAIATGGAVYAVWVVAYFVTFWSTTGQTPGDYALGIRVRPASARGGLPPRRALLRFAGLVLAAIPLFAGFLPILFDERRRGLHDMIARTVVVDDRVAELEGGEAA